MADEIKPSERKSFYFSVLATELDTGYTVSLRSDLPVSAVYLKWSTDTVGPSTPLPGLTNFDVMVKNQNEIKLASSRSRQALIAVEINAASEETHFSLILEKS